MFFANADYVKDSIEELRIADTRTIVLDAETSPFLDVSAAQMLGQLRDALKRTGVDLRVARDIGQFCDTMRRADSETSPVGLYPTVRDALADVSRKRPEEDS